MNHIYLYKMIKQEIHVQIFLLSDWMLKKLYYFSKYQCYIIAAPSQLCVAISDHGSYNEL